jgi:hypothetical protein
VEEWPKGAVGSRLCPLSSEQGQLPSGVKRERAAGRGMHLAPWHLLFLPHLHSLLSSPKILVHMCTHSTFIYMCVQKSTHMHTHKSTQELKQISGKDGVVCNFIFSCAAQRCSGPGVQDSGNPGKDR